MVNPHRLQNINRSFDLHTGTIIKCLRILNFNFEKKKELEPLYLFDAFAKCASPVILPIPVDISETMT